MNSVKYLLDNPFSNLSYDEKLAVKYLKRPTPELNLVHKQSLKGKEILRKFKSDIYKKNSWICGCEEKNALFCFPCLLFGGEISWTESGVTDLVHLSVKIKKHENSEVHIKNILNLSLLGKINIKKVLNSDYRRTVQKHNEEVTKNRLVLNLIINCIRFCGAFESAVRCHDEGESPGNKGIFRELIDFSSELDHAMKEHLQKAPVFKGTSKIIQNELLDVMLQVYHEEVASEIKKADFVAVIADETTEITNQFQLVIILRYIVNGKLVERFWKLLNPTGHDADSLSKCILNEITLCVTEPEKLVAQSYDGATVTSYGLSNVQKRIQDIYPRADFVHCYAHHTSLKIVSNASSGNSQCRIFFANLAGLCSFFSSSPKRARMLDEVIRRKGLPRSPKTRWNFNSRMVSTVYEYREELVDVLEDIEKSEDTKVQTTIQQAGAYVRVLEDENFIFWLSVFHKIMPHVEMPFAQMKKRIANAAKIRNAVGNFEKAIQKIRSEIADCGVNDTLHQSDTEQPRPSKCRRISNSDKTREAVEVCDIVLSEIKTRFQFTGHLVASNLFLSERFATFDEQFPEEYLKETIKCYPFLDEKRLKTELKVLYEREELRQNSGAASLLYFLLEDGLNNAFQETIKLLKIIITIPVTTSEADRCFSMLERIKTFLRNTVKEDRLNALSMLSCEKEFVNEIENFNGRVIDMFASKKDRKMDFVYRQL